MFGKIFGMLGLYIVVKAIISSLLVVFGYLKASKDISLAFNMLASIRDLGCFYSGNVVVFFSSLKRFSFTHSTSAIVHIRLARENGIFVKQSRGSFDVNETYHFEPAGLLQILSRFLYKFCLSL